MIEGYPPPVIVWNFNTAEAYELSRLFKSEQKLNETNETGEKIVINKTEKENAGQYICVAVNSKGHDFHQVMLFVKGKL